MRRDIIKHPHDRRERYTRRPFAHGREVASEAEIVRLYREHKTYAEIEQALHTSGDTIRAVLVKHKVPIRASSVRLQQLKSMWRRVQEREATQ